MFNKGENVRFINRIVIDLKIIHISIYRYFSGLIFGLKISQFCQSFLTYRAKFRRRSKMSWFHIKWKCNDWSGEIDQKLWYFKRNDFVENIRNICSLFITATKQSFQLISNFFFSFSSLALLLFWLASLSWLASHAKYFVNIHNIQWISLHYFIYMCIVPASSVSTSTCIDHNVFMVSFLSETNCFATLVVGLFFQWKK